MNPQQLGRYELKEQLGRGGMATVYRAYDPRFKRDVAVKVLPRELMLDPQFRARFEREAETIAALEHPAIVPVYDFGEEEGQPFLVMRQMTGGSLADRLLQGPVPVTEAARILERIGSALDRAHEHGIVHRDLKPGNILFDQYGEAFLADFGIVRLADSTATLTGEGGMVGTPAYISPEQIQGSPLDGRTDIYALGIIVFEMLTGKRPFEADTPAMMLVKQMTEPMPRVLDLNPDLPPNWEYVITRATAKAADDRFQTAGEMADTVASSRPIQPVYVPPVPPTVTPEPAPTPTAVIPPIMPPTPETPAAKRRVPVWVLIVAGTLLVCICGSLAITLNQLEKQMETITARINGPTIPTREPISQTRSFAPMLPTVVMGTAATSPITADNISQMISLLQLGRGTVNAATLSPDGQRLALGSSLGVWIYDAHTLAVQTLLQGHTSMVSAVAWSPDGSQIASGSWDGTVRQWDVASGAQTGIITLDDQVLAVAWSPDGSTLATSTWGSALELWDSVSGQKTGELTGNENSITRLAWSPDGVLLASADDGEAATVRLWDVAAGKTEAVLSGHVGDIANLTWSPDSSRLISSGGQDATARIWGADGTEQLVLLGHEYGVYDAAWSPDGSQILTTGGDNSTRQWDAATGRQLNTLPTGISPAIRLIWLADSDQLVQFLQDGTILLTDSAGIVAETEREHPAAVSDVAWSPDGTQVATANVDTTVRLWDAVTGEQLALWEGHEYGATAVSWSPDGRTVASGGEDGHVRFWDVAEGIETNFWENPEYTGISTVAWSPAGDTLAIADWDGHVWIGDAATQEIVVDWSAHKDSVTHISWSPDGTELATSSRDTTVRIWNPLSGTQLQEFSGHTTEVVEDVTWSPDGQQLASAGQDALLRVWQRSSGEQQWQKDHLTPAISAAWSPAGFPLASGGYDGDLFFWDAATGRKLNEFHTHIDAINRLVWSADGSRLASASDDGTVIIWGLAAESND